MSIAMAVCGLVTREMTCVLNLEIILAHRASSHRLSFFVSFRRLASRPAEALEGQRR